MNLTRQEIEAVRRREVLRVQVPEVDGDLILLHADFYDEIEEVLREERARDEWASLVKRSLSQWAEEDAR